MNTALALMLLFSVQNRTSLEGFAVKLGPVTACPAPAL